MHYQTRLMPTDASGGFVVVTCHGEHEVGGDDPREVHHARVQTGNASSPADLQDMSAVVFPALAASSGRVSHMSRLAQGQAELARSGKYSPPMSEHYKESERAMRHAARLAAIDTIRVPTHVHASANGLLLCGFRSALRETSGEAMPGRLRLVDLQRSAAVREWSSARLPMHGPGKGAERFTSRQLGTPLGLSADGQTVLLYADVSGRLGIVECRLDERLAETARIPLPAGPIKALPAGNGWIAVSEANAVQFERGGRVRRSMELPKNSVYWEAIASPTGDFLVVPTFAPGEFWVVHWHGAKARRFRPHRGVALDATASVAISSCGGWVASHCQGTLVVTRLADGVSWPAARLDARTIETPSYDGYSVRSYLPAAFNFIGAALLTSTGDGVAAVPIVDGDSAAFVSEHGRAGARTPVKVSKRMAFDVLMTEARMQAHMDAMRGVYSPGVGLRTQALGKRGWASPGSPGAAALGTSRFGGWPDLPAGTAWPTWQGRPMAFLAQINLADAHAAAPELRLPRQGLLSFFLGCSEDTFRPDGSAHVQYMADEMLGTEAMSGAAWRVMHHADAAHLVRTPCASDPSPQLFQPCSVCFANRALPLPDECAVAYSLLPLQPEAREDYNEAIGQLLPADDEGIDDQLLGYPRLLQFTPPELMCELSSRGENPWRIPPESHPDYPPLACAAAEWTLLLQLTSNPDADFQWGDAGHLYFYGKRAAMERGDFSGVWVNFEN